MTRFSRPGWRSLAGLVLSAALLGLYLCSGVGYLLGFIALVPWLLALNTIPTLAGNARSGLLMSIAVVATVFAWFGAAIGAYTGVGSATGLLLVLIAAPLLQPQIFVFAIVRHIAGRRYGPIIRALAGASAWVATEWLVPKLLGDTIGHGLYPSLYLRQIADVGGAAGITFLLILVNECVASAITHRRDKKQLWAKPLAIAACLLISMTVYGAYRLSTLKNTQDVSEKPLRIGMVQSNIFDYENLRREMGAYEVVRHVLDTHYAMSRVAVEQHHVDALLWSETVYPTTFANPKSAGGAELDKEILDFVTATKVPLVFGTYDLDDKGEYNAAAFVEPTVGTLGFYRKTDLFFLTEYLPEWLDGPTARRMFPWAGSWKLGSGARVFPLRLADGREIPVLPMICLDDVDTELGIDGARLGAQVILIMSNDSWFTQYPIGAKLHQTVAAFRSIETRLPQMRVTANGFSSVIDASGTVIASTAMSEQKLLIGEVVVIEPPMTLMLAWGNWIGRVGLAFLLLLTAFSVIEIFKQRAPLGASAPSSISTLLSEQNFQVEVLVLTPAWRALVSLLQIFAVAGLLWLGMGLFLQDAELSNPLTQMRMFAALVLVPMAAAWSIMRAFAATMRIENEMLVVEQHERRIEIRVKDIAAVEPWIFPLLRTGVLLRMESGKCWSHGIAVADIAALVNALIGAGAEAKLANTLTGFSATYSRVRAGVASWRIDHLLIKFVLFPLVPALPAFRLHQHIAFGGTFGEYQTYGLKAYLIALLIWWASWIIGLALFAALLRTVIEAGTLLSMALRPESAIDVRKWLEFLGRVLFFVGIPVWLMIRFWP
jgi:apolipoprotein N-acyltransferase